MFKKKDKHLYTNCPENTQGLRGTGNLGDVYCKFCLNFFNSPVWSDDKAFTEAIKTWHYKKDFEQILGENNETKTK